MVSRAAVRAAAVALLTLMLSLITAPTTEPLTWAQVQKQVRQEGVDDDKDFVTSIVIPAARERGEIATRRAFPPQTWQLLLDAFPPEGFIEIPKPPLTAVDFVQYLDTQGVTRTLIAGTDYIVQKPAGPRCGRGRIALPFGGVWPVALPQMGAITVQFQCGYTAVPPLLVAAMLLDCGRLYEHRETIVVDTRAAAIELPGGAKDIYRSFLSRGVQLLPDDPAPLV